MAVISSSRPCGRPQRRRGRTLDRRAFLAALVAAPLPVAQAGSSLADRVARRYRVAPVAAALVVGTAREVFPEDPVLLVALACVESSLRPFAVGMAGEIGLTQVRPELHGLEPAALIEPRGSLEAGARILRQCVKRAGGDVARGLAFYNGAGEMAERYAARVLTEKQRLMKL